MPNEPMRTKQMDGACADCGRKYGDKYGFPDLVIDDAAWKAISPRGHHGGLLCPSCICRRLHQMGLKPVGRFVSGPLADPADTLPMPRRLTAENGAKAALSAEFTIPVTMICPDCYGDAVKDEDCEICHGATEYSQPVTVDWTMIKDIYAAAVAHFHPEKPQ